MGIRIRRNGISDNVVPTLQAANMYMIAELVEECNMNVQKKLKPDGLLIVLSVAESLGEVLPQESRDLNCRDVRGTCRVLEL